MRISTLTLFLCLVCNPCLVAQPPELSATKLDSLEKRLATLPSDTNRVNTLNEVATLYSNTNVEKSILLGEEALTLTRKLDYANGFRRILGPLSFQYSISGQWAKGLELALEGKERYKDNLYELSRYSNMAQLAYQFQGDYKRCLEECRENIQLFNSHPEVDFNLIDKWATYMTGSEMYSKIQQPDSALIYAFKSLIYAQSIKINTVHYEGYAHSAIGRAYLAQDMPDSARSHLHIMLAAMEQINNQFALQETQITLAKVMQKKGALDSMYYYAKTAYDGALKMGNDVNEMNAAFVLSDYFENINATKSLFYLKSYNAIKEKLFTQDQTNKRYFLESAQRNKVAELEKKEINTVNRIRQNTLLGILFTLALLAGVLIFTNRNKKLLNDKLQQQKLKIENQNQDLVKSSHELAVKNRDLEIEAALERVRARTMSMQSSSELSEASHLLDQQVRSLGIETWGSAFHIYADNEAGDFEWFSSENGKMPFYKTLRENFFLRFYEKGQHGETFHIEEFSGKACKDHYEYLMTIPFLGDALKAQVAAGISLPASQIDHIAFFKHGYVLFITYKPVPEAHEVFQRFANVFEQTYTRFLDLQKAEAQAREAQIELAIERVRARAMVMHSSDELSQLVATLFEELVKLDLVLARCIIWIMDKETSSARVWMTNSEDTKSANSYFIKSLDHSYYKEIIRQWQERNPKWVYELKGDDKKSIDTLLLTETELSQLPEVVKQGIQSTQRTFISGSFNSFGLIEASGPVSHSEEQLEILHRFGKVFDQNYTRFLDLQKAETQTREARIEGALERVRSRSMGMQRGTDLKGVVKELYDQLRLLGFKWGVASIIIMDSDSGDFDWWMEGFEDGYDLPEKYHVPYFNHIGHHQQIEHWKNGNNYAVIEIAGQDKKIYDSYYFFKTDFAKAPESSKNLMMSLEAVNFSMAYMKYGALSWSPSALDENQSSVLQRMAKVFEQTYTRFLDLQKAEAQAREAQIEISLERIRAASLAMKDSAALGGIIYKLYGELTKLDAKLDRCFIMIVNPENRGSTWWIAGHEGLLAENGFFVQLNQHASHQWYLDCWKKRRKKWQYLFEGKEKRDADHFGFTETELSRLPEFIKKDMAAVEKIHLSGSSDQFGSLVTGSLEPLPDEQQDILSRFSIVFNQAYIRFLDLQKAEAQAREAQIEAALERVRSKTMAMHNSNDVGESVATLFDELVNLGLLAAHDRCGIGIMQPNEAMEVWTAAKTEDGKAELTIGLLNMKTHPVLQGAYGGWEAKKETFQYILEGEDKLNYYHAIRNQSNYKIKRDYFSESSRIVHTDFYFNEGCLYVFSQNEISSESSMMFVRFAHVFGQTYRRYLDLQKAEVQAREAIKQSSIDRVRGEIASMRTTADLDRITPLIWKELTTLGIPFIRCGVFIMDENENKVHTYLSTPDGRAIAAYHIAMDNSGSLAGAIEHWRTRKVFVTHWVESDFQSQADLLLKQGSITSREQYLNSIPKEGFHLHFLPFRQGMLYVGSNEQLQADALQLVQSLADAFSVAYARYEDFTKLESAKTQIEKTLTDLKQTQTQLIQSEKMASLGELTAGIAHEIQNPLNFVNNFSEVSTELVDEMNEELRKGNTEDAKQIAADLKQNLEKINHHGKRAGDIVKGMLQHSRSSSGVKEPTDINGLTDEYLRLAYHGLRAKEKSFNATMKTDFDESIGNIHIIPQDMGRVILNLITNAFYVVNERAKLNQPGYEPTVSVSTKKEGNKVLISVKDNGNGIPQKILDKIFQPFFTTKPTGQGTGLGLSLSYDIVKAHGGELKVETLSAEAAAQAGNEGVGSEFIISLPIKSGSL